MVEPGADLSQRPPAAWPRLPGYTRELREGGTGRATETNAVDVDIALT